MGEVFEGPPSVHMEQEQVGKHFVFVYFSTLIKDPKDLLNLYKENSTLTRSESSGVVTYKGRKEIGQALDNTKPNCLFDVRNIVCQNSFGRSLIVTVSGLVEKPGEEIKRPFTQVFVLHPQQPQGLFVLNEIFLNTDIDAASEKNETPTEENETSIAPEKPEKSEKPEQAKK